MIEYEYTENLIGKVDTRVRLDGKICGVITKVMDGWQYFPKGSKVEGEVYPTFSECQRSLEDD